MKPYRDLFKQWTTILPFPYQERLASESWPEVIDVPTGLGKTAAILSAWLYKRLTSDPDTGRRLVYCLPMRTLVRQTHEVATQLCAKAAPMFTDAALPVPSAHVMLGGDIDDEWAEHPERPTVIIGTQDMLLSRALNRGYGMSRYMWPVQFGLLHNDCLWVLDETQLMGVGVETSAQLEAFRQHLSTLGVAHTIWMSATMGRGQLATVDHPEPDSGYRTLTLSASDHDSPIVHKRITAKKSISRGPVSLGKKDDGSYVTAVATLAADASRTSGGLTLVVVNRVQRAQEIYRAIAALGVERCALIHSRFRPADRRRHEALLHSDQDRVIVATQAVEAGVDVSSRTLITELAPWPSLVQRFGRCNRYGEEEAAKVIWLDVDVADEESIARPYERADLDEARTIIADLADVGPASIRRVEYRPRPVVRPVLRRRDLLELFDTTPDLLGHDIDVARFVRDGNDLDVQVYYRAFDLAEDGRTIVPPGEADGEITDRTLSPTRDELVRVSIRDGKELTKSLAKKAKSLGPSAADRIRRAELTPWTWQPLERGWTKIEQVLPGQLVLLHPNAGGYDPTLGWTGELMPKSPVPTVALNADEEHSADLEAMDADPATFIGSWVSLTVHLGDVGAEAEKLVDAVKLSSPWSETVVTAGAWHDVGKAHDQFQRRLLGSLGDDERPKGEGPWAKSAHRKRPPKGVRKHFRHELASALAWIQTTPPEREHRDLIAYLIAAHHGKVRLSIHSVPGELAAPDETPFARGVWHGDLLPAVELPDGSKTSELTLDLSLMRLGEGSWLERMLALRDHPSLGPFRMAYLEALVRIADWRASAQEAKSA